VCDAGCGGNGDHDHSPKIDRYRTMISSCILLNAPCLLGLRGERQLRVAESGAVAGDDACGDSYQYPQLPVDASHPRFTSTTIAVCCARGACACARRSRARTPGGDGPRRTVAGDHGSEAAVGDSETCTSWASACRCARRVRCLRRAVLARRCAASGISALSAHHAEGEQLEQRKGYEQGEQPRAKENAMSEIKTWPRSGSMAAPAATCRARYG